MTTEDFTKHQTVKYKENMPEQIESSIIFCLENAAKQGNVFLPKEELIQAVKEDTDADMEQIEDAIFQLGFETEIKIDMVDDEEVVYLYSLYKCEQRVCGNLMRIKGAKFQAVNVDVDGLIAKSEMIEGIDLSQKQKDAVISSIREGVSVITGGPGTGKTTIINTILNVMDEAGFNPLIAAPTGRAAKRITETSGREASTIHRLLGYYYSETDKSMHFRKNAQNQLDCDMIIIDESSMIDTYLMDVLLEAIPTGIRLILVGDVDQLPSVGAGNVLRDIIQSDLIHTIVLDEVFRQAEESMIIVNAHRINQGDYPYYNKNENDFLVVNTANELMAIEAIKDLIKTNIKGLYPGRDPIKDIQVVTPVKKGNLGNINLNKTLQEVLNPPSDKKKEKKFTKRLFREGDKVMQLKNNYIINWKRVSDFSDGYGIFNGDIGYIQDIDEERQEITVLFDEDKFVTYGFSELSQIELAYAITVHKSQGSEFPIVILPMSWFPPMLATRNLLYTAVTRAKDAVVVVGFEDKMKFMVDNNMIVKRYSGLKYRMQKFFD